MYYVLTADWSIIFIKIWVKSFGSGTVGTTIVCTISGNVPISIIISSIDVLNKHDNQNHNACAALQYDNLNYIGTSRDPTQ